MNSIRHRAKYTEGGAVQARRGPPAAKRPRTDVGAEQTGWPGVATRDTRVGGVGGRPLPIAGGPWFNVPVPKTFDQVGIAAVAEYWNARPCNIRHSPKDVGSREYFDEVEARKYFVEPHILRFAEFPRWRGKRVLEIGCGIGTDTINFARHGARVTAVDLSERSVEIARQRAQVFGVERQVTFHVANAEELSQIVPVEPYDLVYSFGVLHHTPNPDRAIAQIRRYTTAGSTLKLMVYHRRSWKVMEILLGYGKGRVWDLERLVARYSEAQTGCPVTYTYLTRGIPRLLAGFRIREMWVDHIFPYRVPEYTRYRYVRTWSVRAMPAPVFRWLERHFGWHLCVTAEALAPSGPPNHTAVKAQLL